MARRDLFVISKSSICDIGDPVNRRRAYERIVRYLAICLGLRSDLSIRIIKLVGMCYGAIR